MIPRQAQNAAYASSPSKPLPQPATTTAPALVNPEPTPLASAQVASPIPLSTASFLSYDKPPPALQLEPFRQPDAQEFLPDEMMFQSDQAMDLSSLGISELTAIINGEDYSFVDAKPDIGGGEGSAGGFGGMDQTQTRGTQAATEKLLASLNDLTQQQQQQDQGGVAGDGPQITQAIAEENVDTLLASLQSTQPPAIGNPDQNGEFNFDFQNPDPAVGDGGDGAGGEVDLSELVGLFSDPTTSSGPGQSVPAPVSLDPVPQQNLDALLADAGQEGGYGEETYDLGGIDLEDFNFGDGSIPNVEGDEFEELFAEFK